MDTIFPAPGAKYQRINKNLSLGQLIKQPQAASCVITVGRLFVIALGRKQHIFKVGEMKLDESYFGASRVQGNAIELSATVEMDVAHTAKFLFPHLIWNAKAWR